jgi:hypothetical protein
MNPKVCENWEKSLQAFKAAKTAFENKEPDSEVKKELWMAIGYGQLAMREVDYGLVAAGICFDHLRDIQNLGTKQAIDITLKALKEYQNLLPEEYYLPVPPD